MTVVTLSTQDNVKLLQQLKSGFKRIIYWNKYLSKSELLGQNLNLNHLVEPSLRTSNKRYYLPSVEIKNCNVMIDGKNFFGQPTKDNQNIRKIAIGQGDDYTTGCLLDHPYFINNYKMIALHLSNQQTLDADPRAIEQINFTANLDRAGNTRIYFILEEAKETILDFSQGTVKVL